jgi:hypothetical protein
MNTLHIYFSSKQIQFKLLDQDARFVALLNVPTGERNLLSTVFLFDRYYPSYRLVWRYNDGDSFTTPCFAMAMLERVFGPAKHSVMRLPNAHPE